MNRAVGQLCKNGSSLKATTSPRGNRKQETGNRNGERETQPELSVVVTYGGAPHQRDRCPMRLSKSVKTKPVRRGARLLSHGEVLVKIGLSRVRVWQLMRAGKFPRCRDLDGELAWLESEIDEWILARPFRRLKGDTAA